MTAKELIKELQKHPDWDVRFSNKPKGKARTLYCTQRIEKDEVWGFILTPEQ